jgi:hypothetical protein
MPIKSATWPWASRMSAGTSHYKQLYNSTFGYTETQKKVSNGAVASVIAATAGSMSQDVVVTSGITQPDVPRALVLNVTNATTSPGTVTVSAYNVEGKLMTVPFVVPQGTTGQVNSGIAVAQVVSMTIPRNMGATSTYSLGTRNLLGINHRLYNNNTTVKVYSGTTVYGALTLQAAPTVVENEDDIELNTVTPATTPDGSTFLVIAYAYDNWQGDGSSVNDEPEYSTTTSTSSTSTSTSTTTITTSTSSTSVSTSSTSVSTSSTSTSTSSTSTSTTTAP